MLPVKRFDAAKARLAGAPVDRPALAEAMALDVLAVVAGIVELVLVTDEPALAGAGLPLVPDPPARTHSAAAAAGVAAAVTRGAERVLLLAGDTPAVTAHEVGQLLLGDGPEVVVVLDRHGTGTNGLVLAPPDALEPSFGRGSAARHLAAPGARPFSGPGLATDVDTPDDLEALRALLAGRPPAVAPRTRAVLGA